MDPNYFKTSSALKASSSCSRSACCLPTRALKNVIRALPAILERHPNVVYIVSGVTHPHIRRREGERYREALQALPNTRRCRSPDSQQSIVSTEELVEFVGAADIYITPYQQEAQVVSGTLAIALGAGKAIVSTPYWHAKELLAENRGVIVPFENPGAIAEAVLRLLENDAERHAMRKRAYLYSRGTTWPNTARAYMASFQRARFERSCSESIQQEISSVKPANMVESLPALIQVIADIDGRYGHLLQHAIFSSAKHA